MRNKKKIGAANSKERPEMLIDERRQHILELIQKQGRVLVGVLSQELSISQITIRKDLDYLQSKGLVQRSHGGALRIHSSALVDPTLQEKQKHNFAEKERIAAAAIKMVEEGDCVILDSGTTTTAIAQGLKRFSRLTVITNAVNIAAELAGTDFEVILVDNGSTDPALRSTTGSASTSTSKSTSSEARCVRTRFRWSARWLRTISKRCMLIFSSSASMDSTWRWV